MTAIDSRSASTVHHGKSMWVFVGLLLLANLPNLLPWERELYPSTYWIDMQERLVLCLPLTALYLCFFQRPWRAWLLLWVTCLWWMPVSLAVRLTNFTSISSALIGMAFESTPAELTEFFLTLPPSFYILLVVLNLVFGAVLWWLRRETQMVWALKPRLLYGLPAFALLAAMLTPTLTHSTQPLLKVNSGFAAEAATLFDEGHLPEEQGAPLTLAFPYEVLWGYARHIEGQRIVKAAIAQMRDSQDAITPPSRGAGPDLVVLVLGESSSREDWALFSPGAAATTPRLLARLAEDPGLLVFTNVVAQSTATRYSVPSMLSEHPLFWPDGKSDPKATHSVVRMTQQAGFNTAWLSNQTSGGKYDGPIAVYAKEAQSVAFLNPSGFLQRGSYDEVLIPLLQRHVSSGAPTFAVLHTLGSHFQFSHRYPPAFEQFKPTAPTPSAGANANQGSSLQAYQNSVLYTDYVVDEVIRVVQATGRSAAVLYVSDHGQGLADARCSQPALNRTMARAYEVPALLWVSQGYRNDHPEMLELLRRHRETPYTTRAIYQTLLDLMNGQIDQAAENPSFYRSPTGNEPQSVVSPGMRWTGFHAAAQRNRCVIAPPMN